MDGFKPLSPTQTEVKLAPEEVKLTFESGRISELRASNRMHHGLLDLLTQLGVEI